MSPERRVSRNLSIHHLVDQSVHGRPDRARRAEKDLIQEVNNGPLYNPVFSVVEEVQKILLSVNDPKTLRRATEFMGRFLKSTGSEIADRGARSVSFTPQLMETIGRIKSNDERMKRNRALRFVPENYLRMFEETIPIIEEHQRSNFTGIELIFFPPIVPGEDLEERRESSKESAERSKAWAIWFRGLEPSRQIGRDTLIDYLKKEPDHNEQKALMKRSVNGVSMEGIEKMTYPLSSEDLDRVTSFVIGVVDNPSASDLISLIHLFFRPNWFSDPKGGFTDYRNRNLFAVLNLWYENFLYDLVYKKSDVRDLEIQKILDKMSKYMGNKLANDIYQFAVHSIHTSSEFKDEDLRGKAGIDDAMRQVHPLMDGALSFYERQLKNPATSRMVYMDESGGIYFTEEIAPRLKDRLRELGLLDKYVESIRREEKFVSEHPFEKEHMEAIREYFFSNVGSEFLNKLNLNSDEIDEITKRVINAMIGEELHYLPMQGGVNTIVFSDGSVPKILGLDAVQFTLLGIPGDWSVNVNFNLRTQFLSIIGVLEKNGNLRLKAPVEREIPGLYRMLRHIAILTFHDLVVQKGKEQEEKEKEEGSAPVQVGERKTRVKSRKKVSHKGDLPRTQTDRELIADVYKKTGYTPRRVELHKRLLNGARDYRFAIDLLKQAQEDPNTSEETRAWYQGEVERCRTNLHRASEQKIKNLPALFRLETISDPITSQERYLETWVVEHTSPRPTEDELKSPIKLFERYYKHSSALASLDQLKPWFVGQ